MNCKYCGQPLADGLKFCTNCGAGTEEPTRPAFTAPPVDTPYSLPDTTVRPGSATVYFWISKVFIIAALLTMLFPFISMISNEKLPTHPDGTIFKMSGREMIFGIDSGKFVNSLKSTTIQLAAGALLIALFLPKMSEYLLGISATLLILSVRSVDSNYTFDKKPVSEWKGIIEMKVYPAFYIAICLIIAAAMLAVIDYFKRRPRPEVITPGGAI